MALSFGFPFNSSHALNFARATKSNAAGGSIFTSPIVDCLYNEYNFSKTKIPYFFLDVQSIDQSDPNSLWLNKRLFQRVIGGNANDYQFYPAVLKEKFDGIIFINSTTPTKTFLPTKN